VPETLASDTGQGASPDAPNSVNNREEVVLRGRGCAVKSIMIDEL
jgi:hypothetical protein